MVLDALLWIKNKIDPTLTFRRSCREGICGSCAMNIMGQNTLACTLGIDDCKSSQVKIYPLPHMPVLKDLVPRPDLVLRPARRDRAVAADRDAVARKEWRQTPEDRARLDGLYECILAPAAPPRARATGGTATASSPRRPCSRPIAADRQPRREPGERLDSLHDPFRLYRCHTIMNCANTCPKGLNPAKAIAEIKKMMVAREV